MAEYQLIQEILALSSSRIWDTAKLEWRLHEIYMAKNPDTCLCGKYPIIEICVLNNRVNGNFATVGNCCVKKFIGLPSDKIFQAIKRVCRNCIKSLNSEAIQYAHEKKWINDWESNFYIDIMRKKSLTNKQLVIKSKINTKIAHRLQQTSPAQPKLR